MPTVAFADLPLSCRVPLAWAADNAAAATAGCYERARLAILRSESPSEGAATLNVINAIAVQTLEVLYLTGES